MNFLFENEHFFAVNKEAGWLSVPGRTGTADSRPCLGIELQKSLGIQIFPLHRLDCEVSGLILFAKTAAAHRAASRCFEQRTIHKKYKALTEFTTPPAAAAPVSFEWKSKMVRGKKRSFFAEHGKDCHTKATWLGTLESGGFSLLSWELHPITGRSHQLRVELASRGYMILGDSLYGAKREYTTSAIALRAVELDSSECPQLRDFGLPTLLQLPASMQDFFESP